MHNPLILNSTLKYGAVPFNSIKPEHFIPALKMLLDELNILIQEITNNAELPSFGNTIQLLEVYDAEINRIFDMYFVLSKVQVDKFSLINEEIQKIRTDYRSQIFTNQLLFQKIKILFDLRNQMKLSSEENRLLEIKYIDFIRNGALLSPDGMKRLKDIDLELGNLGAEFSKNKEDYTNDFHLHITNKSRMLGIPDNIIEIAAETAKSQNQSGWVFDLNLSSFLPVITHCHDRGIRKILHLGYWQTCNFGKFNNCHLLTKIVSLKKERAQLLGYETHTDYVLDERMAKKSEKVIHFFDQLYHSASDEARKDVEELKHLAKNKDGLDELQEWDHRYYSEILRKQKFNINDNDLKPFLKFENVLDGLFSLASELFGINLTEIKDIPLYHNDVKAYEVKENDGTHIGLLYLDLFPRQHKSNNTWMSCFQNQGLYKEGKRFPQVIISANITPPTNNKPSLLSSYDVKALYHEFGHALHGLLSKTRFCSMSGVIVADDFVELPSRVMENWAFCPENLSRYAKHYMTNTHIPESLLKSIKESEQFQAGYKLNTSLTIADVEFSIHYDNPADITDIIEYETNIRKKYRIYPDIENSYTASMDFIFSGDPQYGANLYCYQWADFLEANVLEKFKEKGMLDTNTAMLFRKKVLERGNSEDPYLLIEDFLEKKLDPLAMLRKRGLVATNEI